MGMPTAEIKSLNQKHILIDASVPTEGRWKGFFLPSFIPDISLNPESDPESDHQDSDFNLH